MDVKHVIPEPSPDLQIPETKSREELTAARSVGEGNNPAEAPQRAESQEEAKERMRRLRGERIDLTGLDRKLQVPAVEGYHLHWFLESNVPKALAAWYEFVDPSEVPTFDRTIGGRAPGGATEDLGGSRVSQVAGVGEDNRPVQLVLMKIRLEWYYEAQQKIAERNKGIVMQIFSKRRPVRAADESQEDYSQRYTREAAFNMGTGRVKKADSSR